MKSVWHWVLGPIGAAIALLVFSAHSASANAGNWTFFGYGLLGLGIGVFVGEIVHLLVGKDK